MPWTTPTLKETRKLTRDFVTVALGVKTTIPNSALRVITDVMAAVAHLTMRYIDWLADQLLPDTAETEWLDRHGTIWLKNADGTKGRKAATFSSGSVYLTGNEGVIVPEGTRLVYGQVGFRTTEEVELGATQTEVAVIATTEGVIGNIDVNETLSVTDTLAGLDTDATCIEITGGTDVETDDDLRNRVLLRIQNPPMGGDSTDYRLWALAVSGVTRAWCYPLEMGIGTVTVRFMCDDLRASADGIPNIDDVQAVTDYIDTVRPVAVKDRYIVAPIPYYYDLTISELSKDDSTVRARIETALKKMERERLFPGCTLYRSWVDEAISGAIGEDHHELDFDTLPMPSPGHLPMLGTITYEI